MSQQLVVCVWLQLSLSSKNEIKAMTLVHLGRLYRLLPISHSFYVSNISNLPPAGGEGEKMTHEAVNFLLIPNNSDYMDE